MFICQFGEGQQIQYGIEHSIAHCNLYVRHLLLLCIILFVIIYLLFVTYLLGVVCSAYKTILAEILDVPYRIVNDLRPMFGLSRFLKLSVEYLSKHVSRP